MLLVKTKIGPSAIHGIGLFADEFIPKGTVLWRFMPGFDLKIPASELKRLFPPAREQFINYSYSYMTAGTRYYVLCFDDARFLNHANSPNTIDIDNPKDEEGIEFAARDIHIGEELTCDYRTFDIDSANGEEEYIRS